MRIRRARTLLLALLSILLVAAMATTGSQPARAEVTYVSAPSVEAQPYAGKSFTISGSLGAAVAGRTVILQNATSSSWSQVATATTDAEGGYVFKTSATSKTTYRVYSAAPTEIATKILTLTPLPVVRLSMVRASATTATVTGTVYPAVAGKTVKFQLYSSSTWTTKKTLTTDAEGKVRYTYGISTLSQWTPRSYRLYISSTVKSPTVRFLPGPGTTSYPLGQHVIRITTDSGTTPSSTGPVYPGTITSDGRVPGKQNKDGTVGAPVKVTEFGVRGSSTATKVKKPFKLKLSENILPYDSWPLGAQSKRYNLLALFVDNSMIRDRVSQQLARDLPAMAWNPRTQFTELYVNDQYMGVYMFMDAPKIDSNRVDIDKEVGAIVEKDGVSISSDSIEWETTKHQFIKFEDPDTYKHTDGYHESVSSTTATTWNGADALDPEGVTPAKRTAVKAQVQRLENAIYGSKSTGYLNRIGKYLDVPSLIDYYLLREYTKDVDSDFYKSWTFYLPDYTACPVGQEATAPGCGTADGKFFFGPASDFDRSAGATTKSTNIASTSGWFVRGIQSGYSSRQEYHTNQWIAQMAKSPEWVAAVRARWGETKQVYYQAGYKYAPAAKDALTPGGAAFDANAASDRKRWAGYARDYGYRSSTWSGEVDWVTSWYKKRYTWINANV